MSYVKKSTHNKSQTDISSHHAKKKSIPKNKKLALSNFHFYYNKNDLINNKQTDDIWIVSKDIQEDKGTKAFTWLTNENKNIFFKLAKETDNDNTHFYEVIENKHNTPVYIFMDIDKPKYEGIQLNDQQFIDLLCNKFQLFLEIYYQLNIIFELGKNIHVATSHSPKKISYHVKINIECENAYNVELIIKDFIKFMHTFNRNNADEVAAFCSQDKSIIDTSVYSKFRSFRLLYSSKLKKDIGYKLIPFGKSSKEIQDHLVCIHESNPNNPKISHKFADIKIDNTLLQQSYIKFQDVPAWTIEEITFKPMKKIIIDTVKNAIAANYNINTDNIEDTPVSNNIHKFKIKKHSELCPYSTIHKKTAISNIRLLLDHLSPLRVEHYDEWMRVGYALKNTSCELFDEWVHWSKKSPKFNIKVCNEKWNNMTTSDQHTRGITIATIHCLAKHDIGDDKKKIPYNHKENKAPCYHESMYFEFNKEHNSLTHKCDDPTCKIVQATKFSQTKILHHKDIIRRLHCLCDNKYAENTLVQWDEIYNQDGMKQYPTNQGIVCVKAGMGVGKTKGLLDMLDGLDESKSVIVITYSISLANKYLHEFQKYNFKSYQNISGPIHENRLIICLDSMHRINKCNYDYVIIDEGVSVLNHMDSDLMREKSIVSANLFATLVESQRVYFLDAQVDNILVYNYVDLLSKEKDCKPYWIKNEFVRKDNKIANIKVCTKHNTKAREQAIIQIIDLLENNKKVAVASSTKGFADEIFERIQQKYGDTKKVTEVVQKINNNKKHKIKRNTINIQKNKINKYFKINTNKRNIISYPKKQTIKKKTKQLQINFDITSDSKKIKKVILHTRDTNKEELKNVNKLWKTADCVVYSPSVTAGISFEHEHFDHLVAYFENSTMTPSVDMAIQQLYRVRKVPEMSIYIKNNNIWDKQKYPCTEDEVDNMLSNSIAEVNALIPEIDVNHIQRKTEKKEDEVVFTFNKEDPSYVLLKGIILNKYRSLHYFLQNIEYTLKNTYGIETNTEFLDELETTGKLDDLKKEVKEITFHPKMIISRDEHTKLCFKEDPLTQEEKLSMWIFKMVDKWQVEPIKVDQQFFDKFIGPAEKNNMKKKLNLFYKCKRTIDLVNYSDLENRTRWLNKLKNTVNSKHTDIDLYKELQNNYYRHLIIGAQVINAIITKDDNNEIEKIKHSITNNLFRGTNIQIKAREIAKQMKMYLENIDKNTWKTIKDMYDEKRVYQNLDEVLECNTKLNNLFSKIMSTCFGVDIGNESRGSKSSKMYTYSDTTKYIRAESWFILNNKYKSDLFKLKNQRKENKNINNDWCYDFIDF